MVGGGEIGRRFWWRWGWRNRSSDVEVCVVFGRVVSFFVERAGERR